MTSDSSQPLRTPLHGQHVALHARMVSFAGWEMPLQYPSGILAEHQAVRTSWGVFDVSHMGRITLFGDDAAPWLDSLLTNDISGLKQGQARYSFICQRDGGILDDVVVYRRTGEAFLLVCNAGNREAVIEWMKMFTEDDTDEGEDPDDPLIGPNLKRLVAPAIEPPVIGDRTTTTSMLAVQGPLAVEKTSLVLGGLPPLKRFHGADVPWGDGMVLVTRTGYTGEDGLELMTTPQAGVALWEALTRAGAVPCGLGARDTLRLEAGLPLHGQDIDPSTNPLEAGLERFVRTSRSEFVGKAALAEAAEEGIKRRLIGFKTVERGAVPRHGAQVLASGSVVGTVTSGNFAPSLGMNIGMAYVPTEFSSPGRRLQVDIRGKRVEVEVTPLPYYHKGPK